MSMLDVLEKEINNLNVLDGNLPDIVNAVADSIPTNIPYRMKIAIAVSEIVLFTSQFRINIQHWNGSIIPINSIMFCIAKSGACKDSSVKGARKCFNNAYEKLNEIRKKSCIDRAIEKATEAGYDNPDRFASYKEFYIAPNPIFTSISTQEGFVQHLNDLSEGQYGAGFTFSGEFGQELSTNPNLTEIVKLLAELYDEGNKEVKVLKARENQSKEIKSLPTSALFLGSQDNLLYNEDIKKKFKVEFTTKLARRSFFIFVKEDVPEDEYSSVDEMIEKEKEAEDKCINIRNEVIEYIDNLTQDLFKYKDTTIKVSNEVRDLFILYKKYNEALAATIDSQLPITKLTRTHLQWKALKLSGALALMDCSHTIDVEHYKAAMEFVELINNDVTIFEKELVKEPYELFTDYCKLYAYNGEYHMSLHDLRKLGFISMKNNSGASMKELVKLVNSYDPLGNYSFKDDVIYYKEVKKTDSILLSYLPCSGDKKQRAVKCSEGYQCEELQFSDLGEMLKGDYAYSPFKFMNGVRGKENIVSACKWLVLDVDTSEITDEEAHFLLSDLNHYVVRTSNKSNPNKYRIILELDSEIDLTDNQWKQFLVAVTTDLGIVADILPKSQIFFSYKDRNILSVLDQVPLETKPYLNNIAIIEPKPKITKSVGSKMLEDPISTFDKAFNAKDGEGSRKIIWACRYARELGATKDYCVDLIQQINDYWVYSMEPSRIEALKRQVSRWIF